MGGLGNVGDNVFEAPRRHVSRHEHARLRSRRSACGAAGGWMVARRATSRSRCGQVRQGRRHADRRRRDRRPARCRSARSGRHHAELGALGAGHVDGRQATGRRTGSRNCERASGDAMRSGLVRSRRSCLRRVRAPGTTATARSFRRRRELFAPGIASTRIFRRPPHDFAGRQHRAVVQPQSPGRRRRLRHLDVAARRRSAGARPKPVPFNSPARDFDPAFSRRRHVSSISAPIGRAASAATTSSACPSRRGDFGTREHLGPAVNIRGQRMGADAVARRTHAAVLEQRPRRRGPHGPVHRARAATGDSPRRAHCPATSTPAADEFDATFLADGSTVVFSRAPDLATDRRPPVSRAADADGVTTRGNVLPAGGEHAGQRHLRADARLVGRNRVDVHHAPARRQRARGVDVYLVTMRVR